MAKMLMFHFLNASFGGPYNLRGWDYRDAGVNPTNPGKEPEG